MLILAIVELSMLYGPLRPHPGQAVSAARLHDDGRVQDAYSLRCALQVTGAVRDRLCKVVAKS